MQIQSFIDNAFYQSNNQFIKSNPFTHEKLHEVSSCDLMGLITAIQSANRAFGDFKVSKYAERVALIKKIISCLESRKDEFARLEALDQGLSFSTTFKYGIELAIAAMLECKSQVAPDGAHYSPVGVVVIVATWNLSLRVILDRLVPALLAGNAVVVKVSSQSPVTVHILAELILAAEVPKGLINVIVTNEAEVKAALVSHPGVRAVSVVGRVETATEVLPLLNRSSLQNFKKIQISSGSKNSAVALNAPDHFADSILDSFLAGQGQLGWNSARLFIIEKFETEWEQKISDYLSGLRPSEGIEDNSIWTPVLKAGSFEKFGEIKATAYDDKAKLLECPFTLNDVQKKKFLPAVFTKDMSRCSTLQQDQVHAPFYILSTVKYPFDVAKYSNVSYFGFAAHLWGEPEKLGKVADGLDVGLVTYNKSSLEVAGAVTAVKQSGFGLQDFQSFGSFFSNVKKMS